MESTQEQPVYIEDTVDERLTGMGQRVLRELLQTPAFKEAVLIAIEDINADDAAELVKTFLWEDAAFGMSVMAAAPGLINYVVEMILELGRQFAALPDPLLKDLILQIFKGIETERLERLPEVYGSFLDEAVWNDPIVVDGLLKALGAAGSSSMHFSGQTIDRIASHVQTCGNGHGAYLDRDAVGSMINSSLRLFNQGMDRNPDVLKDLVCRVDRDEFKRAATTVFNMILDSIVPIARLIAGTLINRLKRIFSHIKKPATGRT